MSMLQKVLVRTLAEDAKTQGPQAVQDAIREGHEQLRVEMDTSKPAAIEKACRPSQRSGSRFERRSGKDVDYLG